MALPQVDSMAKSFMYKPTPNCKPPNYLGREYEFWGAMNRRGGLMMGASSEFSKKITKEFANVGITGTIFFH